MLQNLASLSRLASTLPSFKGPTLKPAAATTKPAKKWDYEVHTHTHISSFDSIRFDSI